MALPERRTPQPDEQPRSGRSVTEPDWHDLYEIENPAEVDALVRRYPKMAPTLAQAAAEILTRFGRDTRLLLRHVVDPDDEPPSDYLALGILSDLGDDEAYARLDRLDEEWWLSAAREVGSDLTINVTHG